MKIETGVYRAIKYTPSDLSNLYLFTNRDYLVEDEPLIWIENNYTDTYKGDVFQVSGITNRATYDDYRTYNQINLDFLNLTTRFSRKFLEKFYSLALLNISNNGLATCPYINSNTQLQTIFVQASSANFSDISNLKRLVNLVAYRSKVAITDISNNTDLTNVRLHYTDSKISSVINSPRIKFLTTERTFTDVEDINNILSDLIINNTTSSENGIFTCDDLAGIDNNLETQLIDLGWTIIKYVL